MVLGLSAIIARLVIKHLVFVITKSNVVSIFEFLFFHRIVIHISAIGTVQIPDGDFEHLREIRIGHKRNHCMLTTYPTPIQLQAVAMVAADGEIPLRHFNFRNNGTMNNMFQFNQDSFLINAQ